ncbi:hypothetical protein [Pseudomonas sp. Marseille-QA0332]
MSWPLAALKAIPAWIWLFLAAAGVIWWQHSEIQNLRADIRDQSDLVGQCKLARDSLLGLVNEQGKALGDLQLAAQQRQAQAEQAVKDARTEAQTDYAAANRLQQERTGGDQCAAATSIIDTELGL